MKPLQRLTILGLGLIGGSLAAALKQRGLVAETLAWGRREASLARGRELGVIDGYSLDLATAVAGADLVVVATPTRTVEAVLAELGPLLQQPGQAHTLVTDVASVKGNVVAAAAALGPARSRLDRKSTRLNSSH